jgi:predicted negative regulator of RcsB-dependent stress response
VARITRKELKTDKFALEIGQTVTFFEEHRRQVLRYAAVAAAVALVVGGVALYRRHQHTARQEALGRAIQVQEAPVGKANPGNPLSFPTQEAKDQETTRVFGEIDRQHSGTAEGAIAGYYLGCIAADQGRLAEAEKRFKKVAEEGEAKYASLAKLSLAQIYFADGRADTGEKMLRDMIARPTVFVSQAQATLTLARALLRSKPAEARKLLDPLRGTRDAVSGAALQLYTELPPQ